jgi:predicted dehydrogenase
VGIGHWGPNLVRSLENTGKARVIWLCDLSQERLEAVGRKYPDARITSDSNEILRDKSVDAVVISTPTVTHFKLAREVLEAGKHVLVEKPLATSSDQVETLTRLAREKGKILMVGHIFEFNSTVIELKRLINSGELGKIYYLNFERTNMGPVRTDVNALWDLATHDISILYFLFDRDPLEITASGESFLNDKIEDAVFATFRFQEGPVAHIHASWLFPRKVRQITVVGDKKMVIWDDLDLNSPIKIFDVKRYPDDEKIPNETFLGYKMLGLSEEFSPPVEQNEPLRAECEHFLDCILSGQFPQTDGYNAYRVVKALEAATKSMKNGSTAIPIGYKVSI